MLPIIGAVKLSELRRRDVRNVTDAMLRRGVAVEATRVFEDVRAMVRWAVQHEYLDANPLDGMSKPAEATSSNRVLSDDEIRTLWHGLPKALARSIASQRIITLCLVTGQRVGEVAGMTTGELDLKAREWRLPGERTKNGHPHVVPLSDLALTIIREAKEDNDRTTDRLCGEVLPPESDLSFDQFWSAIREEPGPTGPALREWRKLSADDRRSIFYRIGPNGIDLDRMWAVTWLKERRFAVPALRSDRRAGARFRAAADEMQSRVEIKPGTDEWAAERARKVAAGEPVAFMDQCERNGRRWTIKRPVP